MDETTLTATRRSLHAVAELVIAGPQFRIFGSIELRVRPGGLGGAATDVAIVGHELVGPSARLPLEGSCRSLAAGLGLEVSDLSDVYATGSGVDPDEPITFDPESVDLIVDWFGRGEAALRTLWPDEPAILWPEHFDVGVASDRVNYGASPGDSAHPSPYAYVGPWDSDVLAAARSSDGTFWNASFGASRPAARLTDVEAIVDFFEDARSRQP